MTTVLRVVLDQLVAPTDPDLASASRGLAQALVAAAPDGCAVGAIVPAGPLDFDADALAEVRRLAMARRELAAAWRMGVVAGVGGGLIHSPSLMAPLGRHDRVNGHDQTVVTLWDLRAWETGSGLSRTSRMWQHAMLARVRKHADAIVVPTHAMAQRVEALFGFGERTRVIAGAVPPSFAVPSDAVGRRRAMSIPDVVVAMDASGPAALATGLAAITASGTALPIIVLAQAETDAPGIVAAAQAAGIAPGRVRVRGGLDEADRAAVLDASVLLVAPGRGSGFPWRSVEAMALGVPVVGAASDDHREIVWDGGLLVGAPEDPGGDAEALGEAIARLVGDTEQLARRGVQASDRARAFSWRDAAERVWQLHADL